MNSMAIMLEANLTSLKAYFKLQYYFRFSTDQYISKINELLIIMLQIKHFPEHL